ncbi:helix-turn-helix domain-containing protein [Streptomyces sp. NPDC001852]|uniref:helix-turn-helix domain-containing protein n=1 Tax=Streptomyces sp. NPDC001852 TaxID=3364619 RepID=UPI0036CC6651
MVPDGIVKIMFGFGEPVSMVDAVDPRRRCDAASLVNALRTTAVIGQHSGLLHGVTALLTPLAAYRVFSVPAPQWTDEPVDPVAFLGREGRFLTERLAECSGWDQRFALLDAVFVARFSKGRTCGPDLVHAWRKLHRTAGRARVEELAADCCCSRRHLERRFRECVGLSPKAMAQILRLQSALQLRQGGLRWAQVAAETGYYDQAHFDHVFRSMIGCTPSRFHAHRTTAFSGDPLDFLPGRVTSVLLP